MEAHNYNHAMSCRCGGGVKVFGPSEFAPEAHWGVYCTENSCEMMASGETLEEAIEQWNEDQVLSGYL